MKRRTGVLLAITILAVAFILGGCANTLIGEGGPAPAEDVLGVWAPSGTSADESNTYYLYATGNGTHGTSAFTWRVDAEATDPQRIILTDPSGTETIKAFKFDEENQTLTLFDGKNDSGEKAVYKRQGKLESPALSSMPANLIP